MRRADRSIPFALALRALACVMLCAVTAPATAQLILEKDEVRELQGVSLDEHPGAGIPLDAVFTNARGRVVPLSSYFGDGKPAVLALVYYDCPIVCTMVLDRLVESLNKLDYAAGEDFRLIVISFDHGETTTHARGARLRALGYYDAAARPGVAEGMAFHTGDEVNIRRLTDAVGWNFAPLANGEWSHPVGLTILSPEGKISRYLYGLETPSDQLKLSLLDATDGKIAKSLGERIMHYCFRYDPKAGAYSLEAMALMRLGGLATVVFLAVLIGAMLVGERLRRHARTRPSQDHSDNDRGPSRTARRADRTAGQVS